MKWTYLIEADKDIRALERAAKGSNDPADLFRFLSAKYRSEPKSLFSCASPPRTISAWKRIVDVFGAKLARQPSSGGRYIEIIFPTEELRQLFFTASDCVRPQLSMTAMTASDGPGHYHLEVQLGRGIRAPRLAQVPFVEGDAPRGHPQVAGHGYFNNPPMIDFRVSGRRYNTIVGSGSTDYTSLWRVAGERSIVYYLNYNNALGYVGMTGYYLVDAELQEVPDHGQRWIPEEGANWDYSGDNNIEAVLGPMGLDLPETQIVRRLLNAHEGH